MIKTTTKIIIQGKSASQIYDWLLNLNRERYLKWHPAHKDYMLIKQTNAYIGSVFYFDEVIDGSKINFKWEVIDLRNNECIVTKAIFFYPITLSICFKEMGGATEVVHELRLGFVSNGIERVFDWVIGKLVFTTNKVQALARHAQEEFTNLEKLIT